MTSWLTLFLCGCATTNAPTTREASAKVERAASTAGMHRVPLILSGQNSALVETSLKGRPIVLLLDTGAQGTVIDLRVATEAGVKSTGLSSFGRGIGAGRVAIRQGEIVSLDLAGFPAQVAPQLQDFSGLTANMLRRGGKPVVGLLGYDVLRAYGAIIDLNEGAMYLRNRQ